VCQQTIGVGLTLFHRFYYHHGFTAKHPGNLYAMACLFLACKVCEQPKKYKDVISAFDLAS
jgi:hypothetical protein